MSYDPNAFPDFFNPADPTFQTNQSWFSFPSSADSNAGSIPRSNNEDLWAALSAQASSSSSNNNNNNNSIQSSSPAQSFDQQLNGFGATAADGGLARFFSANNFPSLPFNFGAGSNLTNVSSNVAQNTAAPSAFGGGGGPTFNPGMFGQAGDAAAFFGGIGAINPASSNDGSQHRLSRSASGSNISDAGESPASIGSGGSDHASSAATNVSAGSTGKKDVASQQQVKTPAPTTARTRKASTTAAAKKNAAAQSAAAQHQVGKEKDKVGDKRKEPTDGRPAPGMVKDRRGSKRGSMSGGMPATQQEVEEDVQHSHPNEDDSGDEEDEDDDTPGTGRKRTSDRRKEQNRNAQRAFRERKEKHMKELEDRVASLESTTNDQANENQNLRDLVERLRRENERLTVYETAFQFSFNREYVQPGSMPVSATFQAGAKSAGVQKAAEAARKNSPKAAAARRQGSTGSESASSPSGSTRPTTSSSAGRASGSPEASGSAPTTKGANKTYNEYGDKMQDIWSGMRDPSKGKGSASNSPVAGATAGERQLPKAPEACKTDKYEVDLNGLCAEMEAKASCQEAARKALEEALIQDQHLAHIFKNSGAR